jgi:F-type H+-transporting ATPase subunit gamma
MALTSLRDIKRRIRSVENTQQITKAMEMVSAAKLRRAQGVVTSGRPYDQLLKAAMRELASSMESVPHPYFEESEAKKIVLVVVTSDKGLCGAFNSNVVRRAEAFLRAREDCKLILLGKKAYDYFARRRPEDIILKRTDLGARVDQASAREISRSLSDLFLSKQFDEIYLMYTTFISAMRRNIVTERFLPIEREGTRIESQPGEPGESGAGEETEGSLRREFIFEPGAEEMLAQLMPSYAVSRIYMMLAESFASEHGARMIAMGAATKNADEMIDRLVLTRNRVRQATITKELAEIVGCTEALKYS